MGLEQQQEELLGQALLFNFPPSLSFALTALSRASFRASGGRIGTKQFL